LALTGSCGDPTDWVSDDIPRHRRNGRELETFFGEFPMSVESRRQLLELYTGKRVDLARLPDDAAREDYLSRIPYTEFLRRDWGLSDEAIAYFDGRTPRFFRLAAQPATRARLRLYAYPGFGGLALPADEESAADLNEPYVYHFPDGNASIARLPVRKLVPAAIPGHSMDDLVLARARYET
jgi:spermidine dehydrogenase